MIGYTARLEESANAVMRPPADLQGRGGHNVEYVLVAVRLRFGCDDEYCRMFSFFC